jgi:pimeloyl-ACP methyl ester carboxylesterase
VDVPKTRYARSDGVAIAFQTLGGGPFDLVYVPPVAQHVELAWESPRRARFMHRLASFSRLIVFDKRGTGMSDPVSEPTLEARMDDVRAVMDAAEVERAAVFGAGDATPLCALFAATYPERTTALALYGATPRFVRSREFPWLPTRAEQETLIEEATARRLRGESWGPSDPRVRARSPTATDAEMLEFARVNRLSVSPGAMAAYARQNLDVDVCAVLPTIHVPTLVVGYVVLRIALALGIVVVLWAIALVLVGWGPAHSSQTHTGSAGFWIPWLFVLALACALAFGAHAFRRRLRTARRPLSYAAPDSNRFHAVADAAA